MSNCFIEIQINGETQKVSSPSTLAELLQSFRMDSKTVVVERNRAVVPRDRLAAVRLEEGDEIEVVHFVGGGKGGAKHLVIVESPTKAKTLHRFLGPDYEVEASMGHIRDLPKSKMGVDPKDNFKPNYVIIPRSKKTVSKLKKQAEGKEGIFLAPDPDREGEAISWHLATILGDVMDQGKIHRVVFNEITPDAVREAFRHPRGIDERLVNAQQARRILDRIVGYELSPLLWRKVGRGLSAGRVQSVALRLLIEREREIRHFVPKEYWKLTARLSPEKGEAEGKIFRAQLERIGEKKTEIGNQADAEKLRSAIEKLPFRVQKIETRERRRRPQAPYTTSRLQQEAYTRLGFTAAKTMKVAQQLYEGIELGAQESVGLITYMRTDSVNVAASAQAEAAKWIRAAHGAKFLPKTPPVYKSRKGAQEAHEAIRPSSVFRTPEKVKPFLAEDEFRLYELIWRRFVSSQMVPAVDEVTSVTIVAGENYFFKASGTRNLFPGFGIVFETRAKGPSAESDKESSEEEEEDQELPPLQEGEALRLHELLASQHFTKPPARYNDASLVRTLEEKGIGRPSTYAPTIYTLLDRDYVHRKGGALVPTELGEVVVDLLVKHFPTILDLQFTAQMEEKLDKIEEGGLEWQRVLSDFYAPFSQHLAEARETMRNVRREAVPTDEVCDLCGKAMVIRWGRFGQFLACSGFPACRYTKSLPTGFRCPQPGCDGDLVKRQSKNRRRFYGCSNYPKCTYVTNKLPKDQSLSEDEKPPETEAL